MVRVALVSYLNTTPFLYGLRERGLLSSPSFQFESFYPAACAKALMEGRSDVGLVPAAVVPNLKGFRIVGNTCIGATEAVRSVLLVSEVPLESIETILLDYQSRTSVQLCRLLCADLWKISPQFASADEDYLNTVGATTAAVVIGDRAFDEALKHPFVYDLAEEWKTFSGLPFVFAVWVAAEHVTDEMLKPMLEALEFGVQHVEEAADEISNIYPEHYQLKTYLSTNISYTLDADKRRGLETFLGRISTF